MCTAQPCWSSTNNGHLGLGPPHLLLVLNSELGTRNFFLYLILYLITMFLNPIGYETLQAADRHWAIQFPSIAFLLTRMITNTPYGGRKGIIFFNHIECLFISAGLDQSKIAFGAF